MAPQALGGWHGRARPDRLLLVAALGVAALAARPLVLAQAFATQARKEASVEEVIIRATREADEALTAEVVRVLQEDPYVFADHISVATENGVVRLQGIAYDASDLRRALYLARRVAGGRRVINEVELLQLNDDIN